MYNYGSVGPSLLIESTDHMVEWIITSQSREGIVINFVFLLSLWEVKHTMAVQRSGASCHLVPSHHQTQNLVLRFEDSLLVWVDSVSNRKKK